MFTTSLRKVGGSVMLALPPAVLEMLNLQAGATVGVIVDNGRLVIQPKPKPRYTMAELLTSSDYTEPMTIDEQDWIAAPPRGRELL